jgi:serine/threonine protein kinase
VKRFLGVLVALAALGAAAASVGSIDLRRDTRAQTEASRAADQSLARLNEAVAEQLRGIEPRVGAASSRPEIVSILRTPRESEDPRTIAPTLLDTFAKEAYWEPFRTSYPLTIVSFSEDAPEVEFGPQSAGAKALITQARAKGLATAVIEVNGAPWLAGAQRITLATRKVAAVLVLGTPLNGDLLEQIARRANGAVLVSNGKKLLSAAGPDLAQGQMAVLIGLEKQTAPVTSPSGEWAAVRKELTPGLWLWVFANAHESAAAAAHDAVINKAALWAGAGLIALLSLFIAFRRSSPVGGSEAGISRDGKTSGNSAGPITSTAPGLGLSPSTHSPISNGSPVALEQEAPSPYGATAAFDAPPSARNSKVFGRYTIIAMLGEGGMAQVFTAITEGVEGFRRRFVIKRLRPELANEAAVVAQFIDEAKLGSLMVHSNIIPVFDFGRVGDEYYLATEYILGRDLGHLVSMSMKAHNKPLATGVILQVVAETLKALDYAHNRKGDDGRALGVVHRDVSPSNILISAGGEVKLFDFGIVKAEGRVTQTQHGVVKGNVSFMSPEQARGTNIDGRADLFSLGLVMYYAATGQTLYQGETPYELLVKAATGPDEEALAQIAALPTPLNALVAKALSVSPENRHANASAFLQEISQHLRDFPVDLARLIQELFSIEFAEEERRFSASLPSNSKDRGSASQSAITANRNNSAS